MTRNERDAFRLFIRMIQDAMPRLDGNVPVAFIALPVVKDEGDGILVNYEGRATLLWPSDFPQKDRGPLLARIAEQYREGTVKTV